MDELLSKVKANLILEHTADDTLLKSYITAAVSYAESYQHIPEGYYKENSMHSPWLRLASQCCPSDT